MRAYLDIAKLPGVDHPVFEDKPVNYNPREVFIARIYEGRREYNAFHAYYRARVQALFDAGVSRTVYCVNVDALIAALLLKMLWQPLGRGDISETDLETAAFTIFLYPRMLRCAAEIGDHLNRGRNMEHAYTRFTVLLRGLMAAIRSAAGRWFNADVRRAQRRCGLITERHQLFRKLHLSFRRP